MLSLGEANLTFFTTKDAPGFLDRGPGFEGVVTLALPLAISGGGGGGGGISFLSFSILTLGSTLFKFDEPV